MRKDDLSFLIFKNIVFLTNRDLLLLLKEIDNITLLYACKSCDDVLVCHIAAQFSQLAKEYFLDDLSRIGFVASDQESILAQQRISRIFARLYRQGRLKDWNIKYAA